MASQTDTYANVVSAVEAMAGTSLTTVETTRLKFLVNKRALEAFRKTDYWPEFLVIGEKRFVNGSGVCLSDPSKPEDETDFIGERADTFLRIHKEDPWKTKSVREYGFSQNSDGARLIDYTNQYGVPDFATARNTSGSNVTNLGTSGVSGGGTLDVTMASDSALPIRANDYFSFSAMKTATVPTAVGVDFTVSHEKALGGDPTSVRFASVETGYTGGAGSSNICFLTVPICFATYKKRLTVTYGDGAGETTTVPKRWFNFLVHAVYSDFLRGDGQTEKALAEQSVAHALLDNEIIEVERRVHPLLSTVVRTHGTDQARG